MLLLKSVKVFSYEKGLYFRDREFKGILEKRHQWFIDPFFRVKTCIVSQREPWLIYRDLDVIVKSGALNEEAVVLDLERLPAGAGMD